MSRQRGGSLRRSAALLLVLGLMAAFAGTATAQPGQYTIGAGGDLDWLPTSGGFGPSSSSDPASASGILSGPGGAAAYSVAAGPGIARGSLAGSFAGSGRFDPTLQADAKTELTLVGPAGFVALPVSVNLHVDSTFRVENCAGICIISIRVLGHGGITQITTAAGFIGNDLGLTADSVTGGYHLYGDVTTPVFGMTPNLPTSVSLTLQISVANLNSGSPGSTDFTIGPTTVSFAPTGPVVNGVPAEYTVSGSNVADNRWTDPFAPVEPTTARLSVDPAAPSCGQQVGFDGSASTAAAGAQLVEYRWDFDDGSGVLVTTEATTQHTYASFGVFHPSLVVRDDQGNLSTPGQATVTERDLGAPSAVIGAPATIANGQSVSFDGGTSTDPGAACGSQIVGWTWRIDDNPPVQTTAPTVSSSDFAGQLGPGLHTLTLTVTDNSGNESAPASQQLTVTGGPDIELRFGDGTPMPANPVVDLGDVASGHVAPGAYRIGNVGDATLEVTDITHDTPAAGVGLAPGLSPASASIAPGGSSLAQVGCGGPNPGTTPLNVEFSVFVHSNDADEGSVPFIVRCRVLPSPIIPPPPTPDIELRFADGTPMPDPAVLDLGDVASGDARNQDFEIGNVGDATLVITAFLADPVSQDIHPAGIDSSAVLLHGRTPAHVSCQGANTGSTPSVRTATLSVVSNDPDEGTISFTVRCTILPAPTPDIELRFADGTPMPADNPTIDLGEVASGDRVDGSFRVANVGGAILHITDFSTPFVDQVSRVAEAGFPRDVLPGDDALGTVRCGGINTTTSPVVWSFFVSDIRTNDPDEDHLRFEVRCTILPQLDTAPPTITATGAPGPNANGWNNADVTVSYTCTDTGSGVDQAASSLGNDILTASGTATGTCVDHAGNSASASYAAQIDKVAPTVGFAGNVGTYGLLQTVTITCAAIDPLSGIASTSCQNASGPGWSFGAGPHTLNAGATDRAGNSGSVSTTFTVNVTPGALSSLTKQFVQGSARYQALRPAQRAAVDAIVTVTCNFLLNIGPRTAPALEAQLINAYRQAVQALVQPGWLTASQAATLKTLANAI